MVGRKTLFESSEPADLLRIFFVGCLRLWRELGEGRAWAPGDQALLQRGCLRVWGKLGEGRAWAPGDQALLRRGLGFAMMGGGKFFFYFKLFWPVFCCIFVEDGEFGSIIQLS